MSPPRYVSRTTYHIMSMRPLFPKEEESGKDPGFTGDDNRRPHWDYPPRPVRSNVAIPDFEFRYATQEVRRAPVAQQRQQVLQRQPDTPVLYGQIVHQRSYHPRVKRGLPQSIVFCTGSAADCAVFFAPDTPPPSLMKEDNAATQTRGRHLAVADARNSPTQQDTTQGPLSPDSHDASLEQRAQREAKVKQFMMLEDIEGNVSFPHFVCPRSDSHGLHRGYNDYGPPTQPVPYHDAAKAPTFDHIDPHSRTSHLKVDQSAAGRIVGNNLTAKQSTPQEPWRRLLTLVGRGEGDAMSQQAVQHQYILGSVTREQMHEYAVKYCFGPPLTGHDHSHSASATPMNGHANSPSDPIEGSNGGAQRTARESSSSGARHKTTKLQSQAAARSRAVLGGIGRWLRLSGEWLWEGFLSNKDINYRLLDLKEDLDNYICAS